MASIPRYIILMTVIVIVSISCGNEHKSTVSMDYASGAIPTMRTDSVTMLISDSGIVRYKAIAKTWDEYEQVTDKYRYFPDGIYLEQFDSLFNVVVSVKADTAWNFLNKKLWKLKGNVFIDKPQSGESYESDEFYWDEQKRIIYSDSLVNVIRQGEFVLYAIQFKADDRLTNVKFREVGRHSTNKTVVFFNENEEERDITDEEKAE